MEYNNEEKLFQNLHDVGDFALSDNEKKLMRNELVAFMHDHPVRNTLASRITVSVFLYASFAIHRYGRPAVAFALILVVGIGGTSYAAEGALPGSALYSVKLNVNEKVAGALKFGSKEQAEWSAERATRRLEEAEKLAVRGELDAEKQTQLEELFDAHAAEFARVVAAIEHDNGDAATSADVQSEFEASLKAHRTILAQVIPAGAAVVPAPAIDPAEHADVALFVAEDSTRAASSEVRVRPSNPIVATIERTLSDIEEKRALIETKVAMTSGSARNATAKKLPTVEKKISEARVLAEKLTDRDGEKKKTAAEVRLRLRMAEKVLERSKSKLSAGDYRSAYVDVQAAGRVAQETKISVEADTKLATSTSLPESDIELPEEAQPVQTTLEEATSTAATSTTATTTEATSTATTTNESRIQLRKLLNL